MMFEVISNPFEEMTQGVVTSGLSYRAEKIDKISTWLLWFLLPLLLMVGGIFYFNHQEKKNEEARKLEEEKQKQLKEAKAKQNLINV